MKRKDKTPSQYKQWNGMVLVDNYWIEESKFEDYLKDRAEAAQKAIAAMESFCKNVELQWAGSQDGEAVVGFNDDKSVRTLIHLDPRGIALILSMTPDELVEFLK